MKRRETLKTLLIGGIAGTSMASVACNTDAIDETGNESLQSQGYGRTPSELAHDESIKAEIYLTAEELTTIAVLCDIILPTTNTAGSAGDAMVPEFIDFIIKDIPQHQIPIRGGLMWLNGESNSRFNKSFKDCKSKEQINIIDDIAYPDPNELKPEMAAGRAFFNRMRNLTLTGYYTTKMGIDDLGYKGNSPNIWDGVPQDVLDKHGLAYEESWLPKFVDQSKRNIQVEWDELGNLIS